MLGVKLWCPVQASLTGDTNLPATQAPGTPTPLVSTITGIDQHIPIETHTTTAKMIYFSAEREN